MVARVRVCETFQTGLTPEGTELPIIGGDVVLDGSADVRGSLDLATNGEGMWPDQATDLLAPYGNELFVERGLRYGNGRTEWVSLGYFRINTPEQDVVPDGPIRLTAQDRMAGIKEARLLAPKQYASLTYTRGEIMADLVNEVYPTAVIEWADTDIRDAYVARAMVAEEDRYAFLNDLVTSAGQIWFWDYRGVLVIKPPPDPGSPVFTIDHGRNGVLVEMSRDLSREEVYNAVVATGEAGDTTLPSRGVAYDDNPASPTYWDGKFGKVPRFYSSPFITTNEQAFSAARAILLQSLGVPYSVTFGAIPNAALEPFDPVKVNYPFQSRSRSSQTETHIIDQLRIPLDPDGVMTGSTRKQLLVTIGQVS
nr:DUF5047 domain-containing protein [Kribbella italica]